MVSALAFRPNSFESLIGQDTIVTTLKNAITNNALAQAFLFCGPRGVGKTSCARILAKTINCSNPTKSITACNQCESCQSFINRQSLNIFELDAASNNSVEDIRTLVEQVRFPPYNTGNKKIYIIDEVHMLSTAAFNAFLKTLEEPPKYAIFILATTEKHKIIPTILSRCQIFDFKKIPVITISNHLEEIAKKKNILFDKKGLDIIALKADGGVRDALSMFDQIANFTNNNITYNKTIEILNILDYSLFLEIADHILSQDISNSLLILDNILEKGFSEQLFVSGLCEHFRNIIIASDEKTKILLDTSPKIIKEYQIQAQKTDKKDLLNIIDCITETESTFRNNTNHRLLTEIMLMQLCSENRGLKKKE